jgi:hypothetical protein
MVGDDNDGGALRQLQPCGPPCWGPVQWLALHQMLRGYPEQPSDAKRTALAAYVTALADVLPCESCSGHWRALLAQSPVDTSSRTAALKWSIDAHNTVNKRLGKPVLSYDDAARALAGAGLGSGVSPSPGMAGSGSNQPLWPWIAAVCVLGVAVIVLVVIVAVRRPRISYIRRR